MKRYIYIKKMCHLADNFIQSDLLQMTMEAIKVNKICKYYMTSLS